jgi:hypothetical protein
MAKRERVMRMSVEQPLWRALTGYRVLTMLYAVGLFATAYDEFTRPWVAVAYFAVLCAWTLATLPRVANAARCTKRFLAADLTIAVSAVDMDRRCRPRLRHQGRLALGRARLRPCGRRQPGRARQPGP